MAPLKREMKPLEWIGAGGAFGFAVGSVGGSIYHLGKAAYTYPSGERLVGGIEAIQMNAGRLGRRFALWGGAYSALRCSIIILLGQDDDISGPVIAGAGASALVNIHKGLGAASRSALFFCSAWALVNGTHSYFHYRDQQRYLRTLAYTERQREIAAMRARFSDEEDKPKLVLA